MATTDGDMENFCSGPLGRDLMCPSIFPYIPCLLVLISNPGYEAFCPSCLVQHPGFGSLAEQSPYGSVSFGGHSPSSGEIWGKYYKVASWERSLGASLGLGLTGVSGWIRN